ncbi:MAG: acyl-ACP desaturase [Acidimicrobiales bacterium]|nr:MAG: acyl-ACP desaturase [Acidimicrobiales bacterium]
MVNTPDQDLLETLEATAQRLLDRHLSATKEWFPHTLVPWTQAEDYEPDYEWEPNDAAIPPAVRSALFVNVLTEDNLPYYFRDIERMFGRDGAWGEWVRRWTAEEGRHGMVINTYLQATRAIDPVELERARMIQVQTGAVPEPPTMAEGLAYVSLQELATRISHFNTGSMLTDEVGKKIMRRVASDENHHFLFYRDALTAVMEIDPSSAVIAMEKQTTDFAMPGVGIPGFSGHAKAIADAGIYDLAIHHDQILQPVIMRDWALESIEGLNAEAEESRARLVKYIGRVGKVGRRLAARREEKAAQLEPAPA